MNLIDLYSRGDRCISAPRGTTQTRWDWGGVPWRCLTLPAQKGSELRIRDFTDTHPAWSQPDHFGWFAACQQGSAKLEILMRRGAEILSRSIISVTQGPTLVPVSWPDAGTALGSDVELVIRVANAGKCDGIALLVHRVLSRQQLYDLAKGTGIEIGPGPKPQIHPGPDTVVTYIEEMPREKWIELYDSDGKFQAASADWSLIRTGKAFDLPIEDASLDFIFSSHVFEHLANPLGHLEHWHAKLKPGGVVLAVVPEVSSTKDLHMRPCALDEILCEYDEGLKEPTLRHYERHVTRLGPRRSDPDLARVMMERRESIHVHFYDRPAIAQVLQKAVDRLGYGGFRLLHTPNHKDFYYILKK